MAIPPIEFNGRSFAHDLEWLTVWVLERLIMGARSMDGDGRRVPFFPDTGHLHMQIDIDEGCPNQPSVEEAQAFVWKRCCWVNALLDELRKVFS